MRRGVATTLGALLVLAASASPAFAAAPDAPAAPTVMAGDGQITVSFVAPADPTITGFHATCTGGTNPGPVAGTSSPIVVTGVVDGTSYTCTLDATNSDGTSDESPPSATVKPAGVPDAPSAPSAAITNTQVALTFSPGPANGSAITSFTATCSGGMSPISMSGSASPITVMGLARGTTYTCVVTATNAIGTGAASSAAVVPVPAEVPSAPGRPSLARGNARLTVTFSAPANNGSAITSYTAVCTGGFVPVAVAGPGSPISVTGLTNGTSYACTVAANNAIGSGPASPASFPAIPATVPSAPTQPTVARGIGQVVVKFSVPANNGAAITSFTATCTSPNKGARGAHAGPHSPITVTGLTNGRTYTCVVAATNAAGTGSPSPASASVVAGTAPDPPLMLSVVSGRAPGPVGPLVVSFKVESNNGTPISSFRATCQPVSSGAAKSVTTPGSPITVPGLRTGTAYTCSVVAISASGTSRSSATFTTKVGTPGVPKILSISGHGHGVTINFVVPGNNGNLILHYHGVCRSANGGASTSQFARSSPFSLNGLTPGGRYTCTLTAINGRGEGPAATSVPVRVPFQ